MILDTPTRSLQVLLGEAQATTACDVTACYATSSGSAFTPGTAAAATAGVTPVTVVLPPALGSQCQVSEVRVHNNDTVPHSVILRLLDAATARIVLSGAVLPGGDWLYSPTTLPVSAPSSGMALTLGWGGGMGVTSGTYVFTATAAFPFSIASLDASAGSAGGTITANVRNAGVSVAGLSACAISLPAKTTFTATGGNSLVLAGSAVDVVLALTGAPAGAFLQINGVKL
jgi:hypothetical protein